MGQTRGLQAVERGGRRVAPWVAVCAILVGGLALAAIPAGATAPAPPESPLTGFQEEDLGPDERALRELVQRARIRREAWARAAGPIREAIARDGGLVRGDVQVALRTIQREHLDLREPLYRLAEKHIPKLTRDDPPYPPAFRLRAIGVSLLAGLTLYENARLLQDQLLSTPGVRAVLNQPDPARGIPPNLWDEIERKLYRLEYRSLLEAGIRTLEAGDPSVRVAADPLLAYVSAELAGGRVVPEILGDHGYRQLGRVLGLYGRQLAELLLEVPGQAKLQLSRGVGNVLGAVELREGKLARDERWLAVVKARLRPGDLLLEKTPFRLTDAVIPGHFGHAALYTGTAAELTALGLAADPLVAPFLARVGAGRTIVEALRDGTQLNTVERFLNVDDLAIIRPKAEHVPPADARRAIALAFTHIGKRYDFAFDANTADTLVCSELAFHTYVNVRWPTARVLTSHTMAPDDIGALAGADPSKPFELVLFVHAGRLIHDPAAGVHDEGLYRRLLRPAATESPAADAAGAAPPGPLAGLAER